MTKFEGDIGNFIPDYKGYTPIGSISEGERIIAAMLDAYHIKYETQAAIEIPKYINPSGTAFLDFYCPELGLVIEYNGQQHYLNPTKKQRNRDKYVDEFCKYHDLQIEWIDSTCHQGNPYGLKWDAYLRYKISYLIMKKVLVSKA